MILHWFNQTLVVIIDCSGITFLNFAIKNPIDSGLFAGSNLNTLFAFSFKIDEPGLAYLKLGC